MSRIAFFLAALSLSGCGPEVDCLAVCEANFDQLAVQFGVRRPCLEVETFELADSCFEGDATFQELYSAPLAELDTQSTCREQ